MNETANENGQDTLNGIGLESEQNLESNIDNAFSDLISEFFEGDNNTQNAGNINVGPVLDWDSVADGQLTATPQTATGINLETETDTNETTKTGDELLFSNLEAIYGNETTRQQGTETTESTVKTNEVYKNIDISNNENDQNTVQGNGIYNELGKINTEAIVKNAYGVVTLNGEILNNLANKTEQQTKVTNDVETTNTVGTDFKLTQGNLPAKIGFWTKVRNFFIPESKLQYSVQHPTKTDTGVWNKLQNLFSFGKNK